MSAPPEEEYALILRGFADHDDVVGVGGLAGAFGD
jgi:hypothetical protein